SCGGSLLSSRFRLLGAVLGPALVSTLHAGRVERPAHDVITHARQILHTPTTHEHDGVLLQVVSFAGDVGNDFEPVREAHLRHFSERRVRLLRRSGVDAGAHAAAKWIRLERWRLLLLDDVAATLPDELIDGRHVLGFDDPAANAA